MQMKNQTTITNRLKKMEMKNIEMKNERNVDDAVEVRIALLRVCSCWLRSCSCLL